MPRSSGSHRSTLRVARRTTIAATLGLAAACSGPYVPPPVATVPGLGGTLVVPNKTSSAVTIVDVASGGRLASIAVGSEPHEIALSSDGSTAVTTAMDGSTLSVIDIPERRVARTIELGTNSRTHGIAFLAGDTIVAATSAAARTAVLVNVLRGKVLGSVATAGGRPHILTAVAGGARFYTSEADTRTISEFDANERTLSNTFRVANAPEGMVVVPDGSEVWIGTSTFFRGQVIVLDPQSGTVSTVLTMFGWPYRIHLSPDARSVFVPDIRRGTLRIVDRASRRETGRVRVGGGEPGGLAITPDGRYALQTLTGQARVAIVDIARRTVVGSLDVGETPDGVAYTPRVFAGAP